MFSSNSSGFEKDLANTRAFDLDDPLGESNLELVQAIDECDLEQSCLIRLKNQRQKVESSFIQIEELTKRYEIKDKELSMKSENEKKLQSQVEKLSDMTEYKQSYNQLKQSYDDLLKKEETVSEELNCLKKDYDLAMERA